MTFDLGKLLLELIAAAVGTVRFSILFRYPPAFPLLRTGGLHWLAGLPVGPVVVRVHSAGHIFGHFDPDRLRPVVFDPPATLTLVFLLSGIFTLVPGAYIYYTAYYIFMGAPDQAAASATTTLMFAAAIALGILVGYSLPGRLFGWRRDVNPQDGNDPK